jgi:hypothetical protein
MKPSVRTIIAIVLFCAPVFAEAGPITWGPDTYDPVNDIYFDVAGTACTEASLTATCGSLAYDHDLTAHGFVPGVASQDQLLGGVLEILLRDDANDTPHEGFKLTLDGTLLPGVADAATAFSFDDFSGSLLASIQADGMLHVLLTRQNGDFIFDRSTFTANGTRQDIEGPVEPEAAAVPEPATLFLVGGGVIALATRRRFATSFRG